MMSQIKRLGRNELTMPCKEMAIFLLGKILARKLESGVILKGRIVETECYLGGEDKASKSYNDRRTPGNEPMFMASGTTYVYFTYGMYYCFNISSIEPGAAVLIRAAEPIQGIEVMEEFRKAKKKGPLKETDLCNGPSKLCMAFNMNKNNCNKINLCESDTLWIEDDGKEINGNEIVITSRIGIASAGEEWASKPLRFYILSNPHVSKRDLKAEDKLNSLPIFSNKFTKS